MDFINSQEVLFILFFAIKLLYIYIYIYLYLYVIGSNEKNRLIRVILIDT